MATNSAKFLSDLHKQIDERFSFSEVRTLCFDMGIDFDNVPGDTKSAFIRNLLVSVAREGRLQELVDLVREQRSFINWENVPQGFELPKSIAQEDIRQVVHYNIYHGDVDQSVTYNQQGQTVHGPQVNAGGDANIGHIGDKIDTGGGDFVDGNKTVNEGDNISVGNIENAEGIAIGGGASASVQHEAQPTVPAEPSPTVTSPASTTLTVQQTVDRVNLYLQMASDGKKEAAAELANGMQLILNLAAQQPVDALHLKLLCLGQHQLAQTLSSDIPGIDQAVGHFVTAVQQQS